MNGTSLTPTFTSNLVQTAESRIKAAGSARTGPNLLNTTRESLLSPLKDAQSNSFLKQPDFSKEASPRGGFIHTPISFSSSSVCQVAGEKRIPEGRVYAEIPLEAAKAYPIRLWDGTGLPVKIAYADWNTKRELNKLAIKLEKGGKTAPHPQIAMFVKGPYHIENLLYPSSDPREWATWMELYLDPRNLNLDNLIDSLLRIKLALEGIKT